MASSNATTSGPSVSDALNSLLQEMFVEQFKQNRAIKAQFTGRQHIKRDYTTDASTLRNPPQIGPADKDVVSVEVPYLRVFAISQT
jgi:hypothetical protein